MGGGESGTFFVVVPWSSPNFPTFVKNDDAGGVQEEEPFGSVRHVADAVSRVRGGGGTGQGGGTSCPLYLCSILCESTIAQRPSCFQQMNDPSPVPYAQRLRVRNDMSCAYCAHHHVSFFVLFTTFFLNARAGRVANGTCGAPCGLSTFLGLGGKEQLYKL